jgi:hypothetical protein
MGTLSALRALSREARIVLAVCVLGALARVVAVFLDSPVHPDELFQYVEPGYIHLTGVGIEAWEFRDGLRSWVLPFYNGAWYAAFRAAGVHQGATLVQLIQVQSALVNALLVWVAYRGGASCARRLAGGAQEPSRGAWPGFEGGVCAAFLCASFAMLVWYAGHTLSEQPSMLLLIAGLVEVSELSEENGPATRRTLKKAAIAGALLSFGACLRIANGPLVLIAPIWLLVTRRYGALGALVLAALVPALVFGLVDLFTWGHFAHSYIEYIKFNFIDGKAANFGTAPAVYYVETLWQRAPYAAPLLFVVACLGVRANFAFLLPALLGLLYFSSQPHKEERFIQLVWPLLFIAAGSVLGCAWVRARALPRKGFSYRLRGAMPLVLVLATTLDGALHAKERTWLGAARFRAETVVAADPTLTGLMIDAPIYAGGAAWLNRSAPHFDFNPSVLPNPLITHVVLESDAKERPLAEAAGFKPVRYVNDLVILRRLPAKPSP